MQSRLARIFNPQSNRTVMLAFDHGYFQGPTTGLERIDLSIAPLFEETDVLMCTRGVLRSQVPAATNKPVVKVVRKGEGKSLANENTPMTIDTLKQVIDDMAIDAVKFDPTQK